MIVVRGVSFVVGACVTRLYFSVSLVDTYSMLCLSVNSHVIYCIDLRVVIFHESSSSVMCRCVAIICGLLTNQENYEIFLIISVYTIFSL